MFFLSEQHDNVPKQQIRNVLIITWLLQRYFFTHIPTLYLSNFFDSLFCHLRVPACCFFAISIMAGTLLFLCFINYETITASQLALTGFFIPSPATATGLQN